MEKIILHVLNTRTFSGAENVVISIIRNLREKAPSEFRSVYVSLKGDIQKRLEEEDIEYEIVSKLSVSELRRVEKKYHPNIIHAHDFTASIMCACLPHHVPIISHIHNNSPWIKKISVKTIVYAISCARYQYMLGVSESVFDEFVFGKIFKKKEKIIGNPIDIKLVQNMANISDNREKYDVVYLGRFSQAKNPFAFVQIVEEISKKIPIRAVMIGDGELKEEVQNMIKKMRLEETIDVKNFMKNPYGIVSNARLLCIPSLWEGFGLVAVEALALKVPVLASRVGGLPTIVNQSCGKICDTKDEFVFEAIRLMTDDKYFHGKSVGALKRAEEMDNIDIYISVIKNLYDKM